MSGKRQPQAGSGASNQKLEVLLMLGTILMVFAFVLLALAAFNVPVTSRVNLGWTGMACWALAILIGNFHV